MKGDLSYVLTEHKRTSSNFNITVIFDLVSKLVKIIVLTILLVRFTNSIGVSLTKN